MHGFPRWLVIAALVAAPPTAAAQTLYRCVEKGKPTLFQADPCPASAKTASAVGYVPEANARPYQPAPVHTTRPHRAQPSQAHLHSIPVAGSPTDCELARKHRDAVLGTNNQAGSVDVRRVLNDAVARACS